MFVGVVTISWAREIFEVRVGRAEQLLEALSCIAPTATMNEVLGKGNKLRA